MSRTRTNHEEASDEALRSRVNDLSEMLRRGRSFSGRERNCFFLNRGTSSGGARFANASAVSGLDWPDDGRGLALVDWDADGDLDLWFSNRNAPRIRLMRNESSGRQQSIAFRLIGNGSDTNRDAIGARVEIVVTADESRTLRRTLRAGEGFISQSSKWLHFGLGESDRIEHVQVRWPNASGLSGKIEIFEGVATRGGRYVLSQGTGRAAASARRTQPAAIAARPQASLAPEQAIRIPAVSRVRVLPIRFPDRATGREVVLGGGRPVWVNLWASWCAPCRSELTEIARRAADLRAAGIDVVALSIDNLDLDNGNMEEARRFLMRLRFPFAASAATGQLVDYFELVDNRLSALSKPLPVPTSFLIGAEGDVEFIYKGRVNVDQILRDVKLPRDTLRQRRLAAAPVGGRIIDEPPVKRFAESLEATRLYRLGLAMMDMQTPDGLAIAEHNFEAALAKRPEFAEAHYQIASIHAIRGDTTKALGHFNRAIELNPKSASSFFGLSQVYIITGDVNSAIDNLLHAIRNNPHGTFTSSKLKPPGEDARSREHFKRTLYVHRRAAWQLATSRTDAERDGRESVRWAQRLVEATNGREPYTLMTLAAARAEAGDFEKAVAMADEALKHCRKSPMQEEERAKFIERVESQKSLYIQQQPFRRPAPK